jgi:thioredoxin 1
MSEPTREVLDRSTGVVLMEFGASWCGHCQSLRRDVDALVQSVPHLRHIRVEDGPGQPLGRSFHVKLWPTFVFLLDGQPQSRLVRPSKNDLRAEFAQLARRSARDTT